MHKSKTPETVKKELNRNDKVIAIMGLTGAGKSTLIKALTGDERIKVGHGLDSQTQLISKHHFELGGTTITLLDTPGFDDSGKGNFKNDADVLRYLATYLCDIYDQGKTLDGVVYVHRITENRMGGSAINNFEYFTKLCGQKYYSNITLMTNFWNLIDREEKGEFSQINLANQREKELLSESKFGSLIEFGANYVRCYKPDDLKEVIKSFLSLKTNKEQGLPEIVQEMLYDKKAFNDTVCGQKVNEEMLELQKKHQKDLDELERKIGIETDERIKKLLEEGAAKTKALIEQNDVATAKLNQDFADLKTQFDKERAAWDEEKKKENDFPWWLLFM